MRLHSNDPAVVGQRIAQYVELHEIPDAEHKVSLLDLLLRWTDMVINWAPEAREHARQTALETLGLA